MALEAAFKKIGKGSLWVFSGVILSKLFFLASQVLIGRVLGPGDYGLISLGITVLAVLSIFSLVGLDTGVRRFLSKGKPVGDIVGYSFRIVLFTSVLFSVLLFFSSSFLSDLMFQSQVFEKILKIFALALPLLSLGTLLLRSLEGVMVMKNRFWVEGLVFGVVLLGGVAIALLTRDLVWVALVYVAAYASMFLGGLYAYWTEFKELPKMLDSKKGRELLDYSWPMAFHRSLEILTRYSTIVILGVLLTEFEVGIYSAAASVAVVSTLFLVVTTPAFFPVVSESASKKGISKKIYKVLTKWGLIITLPLFILGIAYSDEIMTLLFGRGFLASGAVFAVLLIGYLAEIIGGPVEMYLGALDRTRLVMINMATSFVLLIALSIYLIPGSGVIGGAWAYAIATIIQKVLGVVELAWLEETVPFKKGSLKILFTGAGVLLVLLLTKNDFSPIASILVLALLLLVYAWTAWKTLDGEDMAVVKGVRSAFNL